MEITHEESRGQRPLGRKLSASRSSHGSWVVGAFPRSDSAPRSILDRLGHWMKRSLVALSAEFPYS